MKHITQGMQEFAKAEYTGSILATETRMYYAFKHLFPSMKEAVSMIESVMTEHLAPYSLATMLEFEDTDDYERYMLLAEFYGIEHDWPEAHEKAFEKMERYYNAHQDDESCAYEETPYEDYARTEMQAIIASR
jgi:hypothetical protein